MTYLRKMYYIQSWYADGLPLHFAALQNNKDVVGLLLKHTADVNAKSKDGKTALYVAAQKENEDVMEVFRQHGGHE